MAKNDKPAERTFGPQSDEESAANAYGAGEVRSRNAADYVTVTTYQGADGLRIEQQVLRSDLEGDYDEEVGPSTFDPNDETFQGLTLEDDNVRESHPAQERPTSDLSKGEREELGRPEPEGASEPGGEEE
jgi:hypothetical protein